MVSSSFYSSMNNTIWIKISILIYNGISYFLINSTIELVSILAVSPWASIQKAPSSILPYNYFPCFPHNRFLWNMAVKIDERWQP